MQIQHFFDNDTATFTYVVSDSLTKRCAIIDSVLGYDIYSGKTNTISVDKVINYIQENSLSVEWILETHAHADHITASNYLRRNLGGKIAIGDRIKEVLNFWVPLFNTSNDTPLDGSQFDRLFKDEEIFLIGSIKVKVLYTPGHTPACVSYLIEDNIFVGDTIFMPYAGTSRTDFPGGSAKTLYHSIKKILSLPDKTRIFTCHDYPKSGDKEQYTSTVLEQRKSNILIHDDISEEEYITTRKERDKGKDVPRFLLPSIQINLRAGDFPMPESNGVQYIKIPLNKL